MECSNYAIAAAIVVAVVASAAASGGSSCCGAALGSSSLKEKMNSSAGLRRTLLLSSRPPIVAVECKDASNHQSCCNLPCCSIVGHTAFEDFGLGEKTSASCGCIADYG